MLEARGISGKLGLSGRLTAAQVRALQDAGHEIGGHTLTHPRLTTLSADEQRREICNDRVALLNQGFRVTSFAYPFGDKDSVTRQLVIDCNYNSARESGGLRTPTGSSSNPASPPGTRPPRRSGSRRTTATPRAAGISGRRGRCCRRPAPTPGPSGRRPPRPRRPKRSAWACRSTWWARSPWTTSRSPTLTRLPLREPGALRTPTLAPAALEVPHPILFRPLAARGNARPGTGASTGRRSDSPGR